MNETRAAWQMFEAIHAVTYFAQESIDAFEGAGLRGFWRGYFAGRAAPMGAVGPGVVVATFFGFRPDFVQRAIPSVWELLPPAEALNARLDGAASALRRVLGDTDVSKAVHEARRTLDGCDVGGRPLFAANADLPWPIDPIEALWHATTLLREHRGDGHVIALVAHDLDPCEAHITQVLGNGESIETVKPYRGWDDDDWSTAIESLRARDVLEPDDSLSPYGAALREEIETDTDALAAFPSGGLLEALEPIARAVAKADIVRYPNPIGVAKPT